jgi:glycosyltransferase involved in cell wall biosynthesis
MRTLIDWEFRTECAILHSSMPRFSFISVIIPVYDDWIALDQCLSSLSQQAKPPDFEVIVIDDGSTEATPDRILQWGGQLPLTTVRRPHSGISAARNHGIQLSKGSLILFVDADCQLDTNCLAALASAAEVFPKHYSFQLRLVGDCSNFVGKTEHLRLTTLQKHLLQPSGCMRYLNTAGFAIRRSKIPIDKGLFEPAAVRGEDTLLLADLMEHAELPFFVADAIVQHEVPQTLLKRLRKDIRSAFLEGGAYAIIAARGIKVRLSNRERGNMVRSMWRISKQPSIGALAFFVTIIRQFLSRITTLVFRLLHRKSRTQEINPSSISENI